MVLNDEPPGFCNWKYPEVYFIYSYIIYIVTIMIM